MYKLEDLENKIHNGVKLNYLEQDNLVRLRDAVIIEKDKLEMEKLELIVKIVSVSITELKEQLREEYDTIDYNINYHTKIINIIQREIDHNYEVNRMTKDCKLYKNIIDVLSCFVDMNELIKKARIKINITFDKKNIINIMQCLNKTLILKDLEGVILEEFNVKATNGSITINVGCMSKYLDNIEDYIIYPFVIYSK